MRRYNYWTDIWVYREDLIAFAWSAPMRDLAAKLELSDTGLKKALVSSGVVTPPQGYWNKVRAGKPVPQAPKPEERRPGEEGRVRVDKRFAKVMRIAPPMSSAGPFATKYVPEDLEQLQRQELAAVGKATVPKSLDRPHKSLRALLTKESKRKEKFASSGWNWDAPLFDSPVAKRQLRILNALFLTLVRRGHDGDVYEHDRKLHARAFVGDTSLSLEVVLKDQHQTSRYSDHNKIIANLPPTTPLTVKVDQSFDGKFTQTWSDDDRGKVEAKLPDIVAGIITAGEAEFRRSLKEAEERIEAQRIADEKQQQERLAALNLQRIGDLHKSGELLRKAQEIRLLVKNVREAVEKDGSVEEVELLQWERWAMAEADKIDPIRTGQYLDHLRPPSLEDE